MSLTMPEIHVGRGAQVGPLTVFPLWTAEPTVVGLTMGLTAEVIAAERDGGPVVGEVQLTNTGSSLALLVEGEILEGGWQHRALVHDVILRPKRSLVAAVACVEAGRWHGDMTHARRGRRASGIVRGAMSAPRAGHLQHDVWDRVSRYEGAMGASPTSSYLDHLDRLPEEVVPAPPPVLDGQRGVIIGLAGHPVLLELFPTHDALCGALPALMAGLLLDAAATAAPAEMTPGRRARRMVAHLDGRSVRRAGGIDAGDGDAHELTTDQAAVRGVTLAGQWAHMTVFNLRHSLVAAS
jgi:hypothetical protein